MIRRAPLRFLAVTVGAWALARSAWLVPWREETPMAVPQAASSRALAQTIASAPVPYVPAGSPLEVSRVLPRAVPIERPAPVLMSSVASGAGAGAPGNSTPEGATAPQPVAVVPALAARPAAPGRWAASAYLFARSGDGPAALAPGGELGGSQAAVRVTYALAPRLALAARASMPLRDSAGAEAAVGVDFLPVPAAALRLSVERRVALGRTGRNAWSAYAAGGFYAGLGAHAELDGYGQAGVVGARRGDLFADGALRAGARLPLDAERTLVLGAGAWGAAQPGASRLDLGPRAALRLPLGDIAASLALEARLRVAGRAAPGSGVALTLAADF